ncbi:Hypothetical protein PHPALM_13556, partial [Phytophthora palmivora]
MRPDEPVGKVLYLPDSYYCHLDDNFCPNSPRNCASTADLMDVVEEEVEVAIDVALGPAETAIDSADEEDEELEPPLASSKELLNAIDSDDDEPDEPDARNLLEVSSMTSDDEELDEATTRRRPRLVTTGAALDLYSMVELTNLSDSDSSTSSEDESESEDEDSESDDEMTIQSIASAPRPSYYLPVDQVDRMIRSQMMEIE